jgi:hypothetical protein
MDNLKLRPRTNSQLGVGSEVNQSLPVYSSYRERAVEKVEVSITVAWDWPRQKSRARYPRITPLSISSHHSLLTFFPWRLNCHWGRLQQSALAQICHAKSGRYD